MTDHEAIILAQANLIRVCGIYQVNECEWEISLFGDDNLYPEDCLVRQFGNALMTNDLSDTQWFYTVEEAIGHLIELGIEQPINLLPLWPHELARITANGVSDW